MIRWLERVLVVIALGCAAWFGLVTVDAMRLRGDVERALAEPPPPPSARDTSRAVGMLEIPRLKLSTPVVLGDDDETLRAAAGHLPDTPRPWERGNAAVAGHRDGVFRPLRHIREGDRIVMTTPHGDFHYDVRELRIVSPDDVSALRARERDSLTLITCFPFNYIGAAPQRFIVRAERVAR